MYFFLHMKKMNIYVPTVCIAFTFLLNYYMLMHDVPHCSRICNKVQFAALFASKVFGKNFKRI